MKKHIHNDTRFHHTQKALSKLLNRRKDDVVMTEFCDATVIIVDFLENFHRLSPRLSSHETIILVTSEQVTVSPKAVVIVTPLSRLGFVLEMLDLINPIPKSGAD